MVGCSHLPGHSSPRAAECKDRSDSLANTAASPLVLMKCKFKGGVSWVTKPVAIYSKLCVVQKWAPTMASLKKHNKRSTTAEKRVSLHQSVDSWRHLKLWQRLFQPRWFFAVWSCSQHLGNCEWQRSPENLLKMRGHLTPLSYLQRNGKPQGAFIHSQVTILPLKSYPSITDVNSS